MKLLNIVIKIIFILLLFSCSSKKDLRTQLKKGVSNNSKPMMNSKGLDLYRTILVDSLDETVFSSDTIIILDIYVPILNNYIVYVYNSNDKKTKNYVIQYDYKNKKPEKIAEKETNSIAIDNILNNKMKEFVEKEKKLRAGQIRIPGSDSFITLAIKEDNKYTFYYEQY